MTEVEALTKKIFAGVLVIFPKTPIKCEKKMRVDTV